MPVRTRAYAIPSPARARTLLAELRRRFSARAEPPAHPRTTYVDTADFKLFRRGGQLALVEEGGARSLRWETLAGRTLHRRADVAAPPASVSDLPPGAFRDELAALVGDAGLVAIVIVTGRRRRLAILDDQAKTVARVVLDEGSTAERAASGERRQLPRTLELQGLAGFERPQRELAEFLEGELGLGPAAASRLERALAAVGVSPSPPAEESPRRLERGLRADEAARRVLRAQLEAMLRHERGVRLDRDPECLHDFRVAVRRTRSALGQLRGIFPAGAVQRFRNDFAWLGEISGPRRDVDVWIEALPSHAASLDAEGREALAPLSDLLRRRRVQDHARLLAGLDSGRFLRLVESWRAFLDSPPAVLPAPENAARPVEEVAAERISRRYAKLVEHGASLTDDSPATELHRLRIDGKKLRYLLEFFRDLFPAREIQALVGALKKLQDVLGEHNDLEIQQRDLRRFAAEIESEGGAAADATLRAIERLRERLVARQRPVRRRIATRLAALGSVETREHVARIATVGAAEVP